jgi:cobyric acid synthase
MAGDIQSRNTVLQISAKFTEDTLKSILKKASGTENVQLINYEIAKGSTRAGDNYLSTLSRLRVDGMTNNKPYSLALIVKGLPANIGLRKTFRSAELFQNEAAFYNKVRCIKYVRYIIITFN